jgi:hypothetical protein
MGTLQEHLCKFVTLSRGIPLRMRIFLEEKKLWRKSKYILCSVDFFPESCAFCEVM